MEADGSPVPVKYLCRMYNDQDSAGEGFRDIYAACVLKHVEVHGGLAAMNNVE